MYILNRTVSGLLVLLLCGSTPVYGGDCHVDLDEEVVVPAHPFDDLSFGHVVLLAGDYVVAGSRGHVLGNGRTPRVYISTGHGYETQYWLQPESSQEETFGAYLAAHGSVLAVASSLAKTRGERSGAVYLFDMESGERLARIVPELVEGAVGFLKGDLALSGDRLYAGGERALDDGSVAPAVFVFDRATGEQVGVVTPPAAALGRGFGASVAANEEYLLVGAPLAPRSRGTGLLYVYDVQTLSLLHTIEPLEDVERDDFARRVALDGDIGVANGGQSSVPQTRGAVFGFDLSTGTQLYRLLPPMASSSTFAESVAASDGLVAVSGDDWVNGEVFIYRSIDGSEIRSIAAGAGERVGGSFRVSLDLDGDRLLVGEQGALGGGGEVWAGQARLIDGVRDPALVADLSGDGCVTDLDLVIFEASWEQQHASADFNCDGVVDAQDLGIILATWGNGCE